MSAALRCLCRRCGGGGVTYFGASDFLDAHQGETVLDMDVTVVTGNPRGHLALVHPAPRSLFTTGKGTLT